MARLRNTKSSYGWLAKLLHWLMALWVIGMFGLGYWMRTLDYYSPWYQRAPELHKSLGAVLAVLIVLRIIWRLLNRQPQPLSNRPFERLAAHITHLGFYVLLVGLAFAGYLFGTADGKPLSVFGLIDIPSAVKSKALADFAGDVHWWLAYCLIALAVLHVLAAFKHHFIDRDATLRRMLR